MLSIKVLYIVINKFEKPELKFILVLAILQNVSQSRKIPSPCQNIGHSRPELLIVWLYPGSRSLYISCSEWTAVWWYLFYKTFHRLHIEDTYDWYTDEINQNISSGKFLRRRRSLTWGAKMKKPSSTQFAEQHVRDTDADLTRHLQINKLWTRRGNVKCICTDRQISTCATFASQFARLAW